MNFPCWILTPLTPKLGNCKSRRALSISDYMGLDNLIILGLIPSSLQGQIKQWLHSKITITERVIYCSFTHVIISCQRRLSISFQDMNIPCMKGSRWRVHRLHRWPALWRRQTATSWADFSSMVEQQRWRMLLIVITLPLNWQLISIAITPFLTIYCEREFSIGISGTNCSHLAERYQTPTRLTSLFCSFY